MYGAVSSGYAEHQSKGPYRTDVRTPSFGPSLSRPTILWGDLFGAAFSYSIMHAIRGTPYSRMPSAFRTVGGPLQFYGSRTTTIVVPATDAGCDRRKSDNFGR